MAKILIIEDNADLRDVMQNILESMGHEVFQAENGAEGLAAHNSNPAQLVITDLHMPEKDGIETIKALRSADNNVRIIAMSGANTFMAETNLETSKNQGADRTFLKPFDHDEFRDAVRELIEGV